VLRVPCAAALLVVLAAGCGGAARPQRAADRLPRSLARGWESRAAAIATAASAGHACRAQQLAVSLREDVAQSEHRLPLRLRSPLLTGVSSLADRTVCTPVATKATPPQKPKPPPPHDKSKHERPPKRHGHDKGDGGGHDG
jgi:hypothetical protein